MDIDDHVCLCFRVSRRKLESFVRIHQPRVPSQLSQCGGAGTGCGWCVPFLKQIHVRATRSGVIELETITIEEYACRRAGYIKEGNGAPPAGAEPDSLPTNQASSL